MRTRLRIDLIHRNKTNRSHPSNEGHIATTLTIVEAATEKRRNKENILVTGLRATHLLP